MKVIGTLFCFPFIIWAVIRVILYYSFSIHCGGHMELAGSANSIELAKQEMGLVVKFAVDNQMTSGYTSVFFNTPDEDVGFWYSNMKSSLEELEAINPDASNLEKSNVLIKLRETVAHHSKDGTRITVPEGISVFPNNVGFFWFGMVSSVIGVLGALMIAKKRD